MTNKTMLLLLMGMLAACSSTPAPKLPQAFEQVQLLDKEAHRALRSGDLLRAQNEFAKTLQLQQSLDDLAGAAATIINLATISHQLHDDAGALIWLDKIVLEKSGIYPDETRIEAEFRKSVVLTNLMRLPEADLSLTGTEKLCDKKCALHFSLDGLRARILLLQGSTREALVLALALSKGEGIVKEEQANALRTADAAEEKLEHYADAMLHFQSALEMDKALGLAARISEDLSGLAHVENNMGREQEAKSYSRRAELVKDSLH